MFVSSSRKLHLVLEHLTLLTPEEVCTLRKTIKVYHGYSVRVWVIAAENSLGTLFLSFCSVANLLMFPRERWTLWTNMLVCSHVSKSFNLCIKSPEKKSTKKGAFNYCKLCDQRHMLPMRVHFV